MRSSFVKSVQIRAHFEQCCTDISTGVLPKFAQSCPVVGQLCAIWANLASSSALLVRFRRMQHAIPGHLGQRNETYPGTTIHQHPVALTPKSFPTQDQGERMVRFLKRLGFVDEEDRLTPLGDSARCTERWSFLKVCAEHGRLEGRQATWAVWRAG